LLASAEMFWIARASDGVSCFHDCNVATRAAMFSAIWVSTGKSANATLIHCALHPVAIKEMHNTTANTILPIKFDFMNASPCGYRWSDLDLWNEYYWPPGTAPCAAERSSALRGPQTKSPPAEADGDSFLEIFEVILRLRQALARPQNYAAFSLACATRKIVLSSKWRPRICNPMGSFSLVSPQGTEIPGIPARSAVTV
jgi:hypothetical protein